MLKNYPWGGNPSHKAKGERGKKKKKKGKESKEKHNKAWSQCCSFTGLSHCASLFNWKLQ